MLIEKAAVDRIIVGKAVLLVGDDQREVVVPLEDLPDGTEEGTWLLVQIENSEIIDAQLDDQQTSKMKDQIRIKMELLRKNTGSRFKL